MSTMTILIPAAVVAGALLAMPKDKKGKGEVLIGLVALLLLAAVAAVVWVVIHFSVKNW